MSFDDLKKTLIPELSEYILDIHNVKLSSHGVLSIDDTRITLKEFTLWFLNFCKDENTKKFLPLLTDAPSPNNLLETLKTEIRVSRSKTRVSAYKDSSDVVRGFSYDGMLPFRSVTNSKRILFYDKHQKKVTELDFDTYASAVDKEFRLDPMPAVIEFNPYRPEQIYLEQSEKYGQECTHINTYLKPEWQIAKRLSVQEAKEFSKLPPIINDFFHHLFPDSSCREFVYDWLHFALESRCETYLVMNGAKGIGKNILSNIICASLLGKENHKIAHKGALEQFNGILRECRMIVFDEFKMVDDDAINALKRYANEQQMIESKGFDVGKTEKIYNSYIICNNALTDLRIEWDDRRFSVADMTEEKLEDVWDAKKINELIEACENPQSEEMRSFGYWLLYRVPKVMTNAFSAFKGERYHKLCYTSFPEWAKMIIDEVIGNTYKTYFEESELKMMFKERTNGMHRFPSMSKIEDFLKNFKYRGENYLGKIEKDERSWYITIDPEFVKKSVDNTGINWKNVDLL